MRLSVIALFFEELNLARKENVLINPKPTRKENYNEHLKKLMLNIAETTSEFLPDFFCCFFVLLCFVLSQVNESNK